MSFCDRGRVRRALEGKRVAIVGSGPSVLENVPGWIDGHEVVCRANNYRTSESAGFRCDIFYSFFGSSIKKTRVELMRDGVKLCMCKCPDAKFMSSPWHERNNKPHGVDFRYIYEARKDWWFCQTYVPSVAEFTVGFDLLGRHIPSTGFAAILDVLSYKPKSVYVTGFDGFTSGVHNVNEPWRAGDPTDPIGHVPEREMQWLRDNRYKYPIQLDETLTEMFAKMESA